MAYDARFDPSLNFTLQQVEAQTARLLGSGGTFGTATFPTLAQIEGFISMRVGEVVMTLEGAGYAGSQAVATVGTPVTMLLSRIVVAGAVTDVESTRPTTSNTQGEASTRFTSYQRTYDDLLKKIPGAALEYMGAVRARDISSGMKVTGTSWDEQQDILDDDDQKAPLFERGFLDLEDRATRDDPEDVRAQ